jgi:hypothetical protein
MKTWLKHLNAAACVLALSVVAPQLAIVPACAAEIPPDPRFPHIVPVETWLATGGFRPGDTISISLVRGDRARLEVGGTYLVQGRYTLASDFAATLALSLTAASSSEGRGKWSDVQRRTVDAGTGTFAFVATMHTPGEFHVSFYFTDPKNPQRSTAQGGIYFDNR